MALNIISGSIPRETKWDVVVDLFFYRDPEEAEKDEQATKEIIAPSNKVSYLIQVWVHQLNIIV